MPDDETPVHIPDLMLSDEHFAEQFPLSPLDDYMIHQTPDPSRVMWSGGPRTYERYWRLCHDPSTEVLVAAGGSIYPNLDRAEAYAIVNHKGRHTTVRGFRNLGVDRADMRIGPIVPRIVRGMRWWRFEPDTHVFVEGIVGYPLDNGTTKQVHYERIGNQTAYLRCGLYGDTPDGDIHQGGYDGPNLVQGETHDVNDPRMRIKLRGLDEHLCRVSCDGEVATGFYQPIDPVAFQACEAGRPGWAFLE